MEILDLPVHFPNHPAFGPISSVGVPIRASPLTIKDCEVSTAKVDSVSAESSEFLMESDQSLSSFSLEDFVLENLTGDDATIGQSPREPGTKNGNQNGLFPQNAVLDSRAK